MGGGFDVGLLGPLVVSAPDGPVPVGGVKLRVLLAALALEVGRPVSSDQLIVYLWGPDASPAARGTLYTYVTRLRRVLTEHTGADPIATRPDCYLLDLPEDAVDVARFDRLVRRARAEREPAEVAALLADGLALWRGDALVDVLSDPLRARYLPVLTELRLTAIELRLAADLRLGRHRDVVGELRELTAEHPLHERFWAQRMLALHGSGRQAEALDAYREIARRLAEDLGVDPGAELTAAHQAVLAGHATLPAAPVTDVERPGRNDLPGDIADFTGRDGELHYLLDVLPTDGDRGTPTVVISAIDGMAGVGKTTLAVRAAHRLADRYPDGQLFIDLRAHSAEHAALTPEAALDTLLRSLGVPAERIPQGLDQRARMWRAELADRRVLVVLDNALNAAQVRPLLPGGAGCLALVTSRQRLGDLDTAGTLSLDVLDPAQALVLFERIVGADRLAGQADAAADVVAQCGYLPLAIRIAAARLRSRPAWTVAQLADMLCDERGRLSELAVGERSVAAALHLSYEQLTTEQRRLFRLVGLVPGPTFDGYAAAALTGQPLDTTVRLLEDLVDTNVVQAYAVGRYRLHELVAQHARSLAAAHESAADRKTAFDRLLDYYVHTAREAAVVLDPDVGIKAVAAVAAPAAMPALADRAAASAWSTLESANLLAAVAAAADRDSAEPAWRLPFLLWRFAFTTGLLREWLPLQERMWSLVADTVDDTERANALRILGIACHHGAARFKDALEYHAQALAAYRRVGDRVAQGRMLNNIANTQTELCHYREAADSYREALALLGEAEEGWRIGILLANLSSLCERLGCDEEALAYGARALAQPAEGRRQIRALVLTTFSAIRLRAGEPEWALELAYKAYAIRCELGHPVGITDVLMRLSAIHSRLGDHARALDLGRTAVAMTENTGEPLNTATAANCLGEAWWAAGEYTSARQQFDRALTLARGYGSAYEEARAHDGLARTIDPTTPHLADRHRMRALEIYDRLGVPEAVRLRELADAT